MTAVRRTIAFALSAAALCLVVPHRVAAQDTTQVQLPTGAPPDPAQRPVTQVRPRGADSVPQAPPPRLIPVPEAEVPRGPLPPGSRYTFTRDSLDWTTARTLADLLGGIPGVYVARGGFLGQSEYVVYGGRGATAVELYWDGVPMPALGADSVYADASRIYLNNLRRVDVEVLPATLRVFLVSERHETIEDRSMVRVASGDYASAQYAGLFQKRWPGGLGLGLAANFVGGDGFSGPNRSDNAFDVWARLEWLPGPRVGATYQFRRQNQDRDPVTLSDTPIPNPRPRMAQHGTRTDALFRVFANTRPRGQGFGGELLLASSDWGRDSVIGEQGVHHIAAVGRYTDTRTSLELTGRLGDIRTTHALSARGGLFLPPGILLSGDAALERYNANRGGRRAHGAVTLFRGPISAVGEISWANAPQSLSLRTDTAVRTLDQAVRVGLELAAISGHAGYARRDAYQPLVFPDLPSIPQLAPSQKSDFFIADARLKPFKSLAFDGWYAHPVRGSADFQPPTHGRAQITFRSKFWKKFRSGAFDLKLQVAMESWSAGTAGLAGGAPIRLNGISFYEAFVSFQIVGFIAFWDIRNAYNAFEEYVPGLAYPRNVQTFGVRWEFFN